MFDVFFEFAEPALQLFELDHRLCQELIALFRRVAEFDVIDHRLVEQLQLGGELCGSLGARQVLLAVFQLDLDLIQGRVDR